MEHQNEDDSQPAEGQRSVQERRQVRLGERDRDSSVTGWHGEHQDEENGAGASRPAGPEPLGPGHSCSQTWGFSMKSPPPGQPKPTWPWQFCAQRHKEQRGLIQRGCAQPGAASTVPPCGQAASAVVPRERASHWQLPHGVGSPRRVRSNIFGSPGSLRQAGSTCRRRQAGHYPGRLSPALRGQLPGHARGRLRAAHSSTSSGDTEQNGRNGPSNLAFLLASLADGEEAARYEDAASPWGEAGRENAAASRAAFAKAGSDSQASACSTGIII